MIDIENETLLTFRQACRHPALRNSTTGRPCHLSKLCRLTEIGTRAANGERVKLEKVRLPSGWAVSSEGIQRFIHRLNYPPESAPGTSLHRRRAQIERAKANLEKAGLEVGGQNNSANYRFTTDGAIASNHP